ncbi:hypothetical protein L6452_17546 [Arctium lappa]|uniref:Uncharacterized protein n=1 Tax=Arctium lappa TaxID=4217 RepID=A0ACB9C3P3_ARCLA|nr:hypothetical protein L6452_17546 [Arctium lappa]
MEKSRTPLNTDHDPDTRWKWYSMETLSTREEEQEQQVKEQLPTATEQQVPKKEVLVVKHRKSHEIDRHPDQETCKSIDKKKTHNSSHITDVSQSTTTTAVSNGEPRKTGGETPSCGRRYSGSKRSYDFDVEMGCKNDDDEVVVVVDGDHHRSQRERRVLSPFPGGVGRMAWWRERKKKIGEKGYLGEN